MNSLEGSGDGFELLQNAMDIHLPETDSNRKRFAVLYASHMNFEAFEFEWSYRHEESLWFRCDWNKSLHRIESFQSRVTAKRGDSPRGERWCAGQASMGVTSGPGLSVNRTRFLRFRIAVPP
jgi:hypothetical protein